MASFSIVADGFITEPYVTTYNLQAKEGQNTIRNIDGDKVGVIVTITAQGKLDKTFYHEVENIAFEGMNAGAKQEGFPNEATRDFWLQKLADDYENSPNY